MATALRTHRSPNFGPRKPVDGAVAIRHIVLHYTGMQNVAQALKRLCDPNHAVSAHYLVDEDGSVYALVPEAERAWHAGVAFWNGVRDVNSTSIGIEVVNPGHEYGYRPFPEAQVAAVIALAADIRDRHGLAATSVLGHSDVAPGRKQDPGELFPWERLARHGLGLWPGAATTAMPEPKAWQALSLIGYATPEGPGGDILDPKTGKADVLAAFQRRFRPEKVDGLLDQGTLDRIGAVSALMSTPPA
jgi:N-acetylmuramoyl-L-alanine amidase